MARVTEFRPTPQMPWIKFLPGKRPDEAMSGPGMLGRRYNRKEAEEKLQQSDAYLSGGQRLRYAGTFGWSVLTAEILWSDETFFVCEYNRPNGEQRESPRGRMDAEKRSRFGNATQLRSERSPHRPGLERPDPRGSRRYQFSPALRSRQHQAQELPSIHPRREGKRKRMSAGSALKLCAGLGTLAPKIWPESV